MPHRLCLLCAAFTLLCACGVAAAGDSPGERTSANGKAIPAGAAVAAFQVRSTTTALAALAGQYGVIDVVRAIPRGGRGGVVVVYYHPKQATPNTMLQKVRQGANAYADLLEPRREKAGDVKLTLVNPTACNGDCFHFVAEMPKGKTATVKAGELPPDWTFVGDGALKFGSRFDVQSAKTTKPAKFEIKLLVKPEGGDEELLVFPVELSHRLEVLKQ